MATAVLGHHFYIFGGQTANEGDNEWKQLNDLWCFDLRTLRWTEIVLRGNSQPRKTSSAILCADPVGSTLWLHGGVSEDEDQAGVWCMRLHTPTSGVWEQVHCVSVGPAVSKHTGFVDGNHLYVVGGVSKGTPLGQCWRLNLVTLEWMELGNPPTAVYSAAGCLEPAQRFFVCMGGVGAEAGDVNATRPGIEVLALRKSELTMPVPSSGHAMATNAAASTAVVKALCLAPKWDVFGTLVHQLKTALTNVPFVIRSLLANGSAVLKYDPEDATAAAGNGTVPAPASFRDQTRLAVVAMAAYTSSDRALVRVCVLRGPPTSRRDECVCGCVAVCVAVCVHVCFCRWGNVSSSNWVRVSPTRYLPRRWLLSPTHGRCECCWTTSILSR